MLCTRKNSSLFNKILYTRQNRVLYKTIRATCALENNFEISFSIIGSSNLFLLIILLDKVQTVMMLMFCPYQKEMVRNDSINRTRLVGYSGLKATRYPFATLFCCALYPFSVSIIVVCESISYVALRFMSNMSHMCVSFCLTSTWLLVDSLR